MNGFVSLVNALAWPVAAFLIALLFRRELREAMGRLGQVKYGGVEVNFRADLREAEALARTAIPADSSDGSPSTPRISLEAAPADATELPGMLVSREASTATTVMVAAGVRPEPNSPRNLDAFHKRCRDSPRLGVLEAHDDLGRAILLAAARLGDRRLPGPIRAESAARFLVDRGWLNGTQGQLIDRLNRLGTLVEHGAGPPLTADDARRYVDLVVPLLDRLGGLV